MPLLGILGGFESHQKQFFVNFEAKYNKRKKLWKNRKISEKYRKKSEKYRKLSGKIGNYREKSEKVGKNRTNEISVHFSFRGSPKKRYFGEISAEKTEIFVHDSDWNHPIRSTETQVTSETIRTTLCSKLEPEFGLHMAPL